MSREEQQSADAPSVGGDLGRPSAATGQEATDPVFAAEQAHLSETYDKLEKIGRDAIAATQRVANGWMGRSPDYKAAFLGTLGANAGFYGEYSGNAKA